MQIHPYASTDLTCLDVLHTFYIRHICHHLSNHRNVTLLDGAVDQAAAAMIQQLNTQISQVDRLKDRHNRVQKVISHHARHQGNHHSK